MSGRRLRIGALVFSGMAPLCRQELAACGCSRPQVLSLPNYDLLLSETDRGSAAGLAGLRTAEDVFLMLGRPVRLERQQHLSRLGSLLDPADVLLGLQLKNTLFGGARPAKPTYVCFVKQDEDRAVYRRDIAERVKCLVGAMFRRWRQADPAAVEFWGFYVQQMLHLGLRLCDSRLRYHGMPPARREGALRPTIAAGMVRLARPSAGQLLIDPMCGSGTILAEAHAIQPAVRCEGGDIDGRAVHMAQERLYRSAPRLQRWDATRLPYAPGSVDRIVCNLPFGKQYGSRYDNRTLYPRLLAEWVRVLAPGGRMVLLTADTRCIEDALTAARAAWERAATVNVLGEKAGMYLVREPQR